MYYGLLGILIIAAVGLLSFGARRRRGWSIGLGGVLLAGTIGFFWVLSLWGEMLWFQTLGYNQRFWTALAAAIGLALGAGVLAGLGVFLLAWPWASGAGTTQRGTALAGAGVGMLLGGLWGRTNWQVALRYWHGVTTETADPIVGRDAGFYLFTLPLYDNLYWLLFATAVIGLAAALVSQLASDRAERRDELESDQPRADQLKRFLRESEFPVASLLLPLGVLLLVVAWGKYLNVYHLMYSQWGTVVGPGWTDAHIRLPAYWIVAVATGVLGAALIVLSILRRRGGQRYVVWSAGAVAVLWGVALWLVPSAVQWMRVQPNEITLERPYIEHNIRLTREAFDLEKVEVREFPVSERLTSETVEEHQHVLSEIRLWDNRALQSVYEQFQEIRLYYEFPDIDIDRYAIDGRYRQVMVSPREMDADNLPEKSQTFVNRHFIYTHGNGITLTPVSEFTSDGLPRLLVRDIPPVAEYESLEVQRPEIYYGDLSDEYVVVNSTEKEFDYPRGDQNVYTHYSGTGGVPVSNLWRKFLFGWKFGGTRFLLSGYTREESRIMFHRNVRERVQTLAPFLRFDRDPYIVLSEGKLYWIIDAYTTSDYYPYSEPFVTERLQFREDGQREVQTGSAAELRGTNYVRNSVKAVVDAREGSVDFYVFEPDDPVIQVWRRSFPELFKDREEMPEDLFRHVRYPEGLLRVQGLLYAKYHMVDPEVFYNQEDLWVRATEKYYGGVQPVEPYYVMWEPPGTDQVEFILMQPFTPKNRQVLIGWLAGMSDGDNYGRLLAYRFPKEKRVLGTQQVETKIDQDRYLSGQLSLWDQRGSRVIRGNVLVIPIAETLLYVEPIYLESEAAAYPELRLVALMHGDRLSYAPTFEEALEGLVGEAPRRPEELRPDALTGQDTRQLARQAQEAFENYLRLLSDQQFQQAASELERLQQTLQGLVEQTEPASQQDAPDALPQAP